VNSRNSYALAAICVFAAALGGCSGLPGQGPSGADIVQQGTASNSDLAPRFLITDLNEHSVSILERTPVASLYKSFADRRPSPSPTIGVGDALTITLWEAAAGGLFSAPSLGSITTGSNSSVVPAQVVARDGSITIPYAGRIQVVGLTPSQVEAGIVRKLSSKAIEPQALVTVSSSVSNTVTVLLEASGATLGPAPVSSGVAVGAGGKALGSGTAEFPLSAGSKVPLSTRGDRILDVLASAGGIQSPAHSTFIALSRGKTTVRVPMQALLDHPEENIYARPGDVITTILDPQTFTVFGATLSNARVEFGAAKISLEEALAKSGGLLDAAANPQGVFLLRTEPLAIARELNPEYRIAPGQTSVNVVYRANLREAVTYFLARRFAVHDKDLIYVAVSPSTELQKALTIFNSVTTTSYSVAAGAQQLR
jgi:polysaccharide biosynthesis/export protein